MKKQNYVFNIPTKLKEDLSQINFGTAIRKNKALKFIHILRNKGFLDNYDMLKYHGLNSKKWFRPIFGGRYLDDFLNILVENEIIQVNDSYSDDLDYSKSYRINERYYNKVESYSNVSYSDKSIHDDNIYFYNSIYSISSISLYHSISTSSIYYFLPTLLHRFSKKDKKQYLSNLKIGFPSIKKKIVNDMIDNLNIDHVSIMNRTKEVVESIDSSKFKADDAVEFKYFQVYNRHLNFSYNTSKEKALIYCQKYGLTLIQDKDNIYIDDLDRYVETKKRNIYSAYTQITTDLKMGLYYVNRNDTNQRLDTIFTSMCKSTFNIIKKNNDLIEIDLVNSQYAILANWLMKEDCYEQEDVRLFCNLAVEGKLYEYLIDQLNPGLDLDKLKRELSEDEFKEEYKKLRDAAKKILMVVCFSSHQFSSPAKTKFINLFPAVNGFIQSFKKEKTVAFKKTLTKEQLKDKSIKKSQSKQFAIELQKRESKIFIDGLMKILLDKGFFVLTKHDSLIIKSKDKDAILKIMFNYFDEINFKASVMADDVIVHNGVLDAPIQDKSIVEHKDTNEQKGADNDTSKHKMDMASFIQRFNAELRYLEPWNRNTNYYSPYTIRKIALRENIDIAGFDMDFDREWNKKYAHAL